MVGSAGAGDTLVGPSFMEAVGRHGGQTHHGSDPGVSERDIDLVFGWQEAMYSRKMQDHYETRFNRDRRYRVTMYL